MLSFSNVKLKLVEYTEIRFLKYHIQGPLKQVHGKNENWLVFYHNMIM